MKHWFKLPDDSVTNLRFLSISRKVGQSPAVVSFVYLSALACASASEDHGSLRDFHPEDIDAFGGLDDGTTASIIEALTVAGMITEDGCIADWEATQSVPTEEAVEDRRAYKREWARRKREESRIADSPASGQPVDSCRHDVDTSGQPVDSCRHHKEKIREDKIREDNINTPPLSPQGETGVGEAPSPKTSSPKEETPKTGEEPQAEDPAQDVKVNFSHGNLAWKEFCYLYSLWPNQQNQEKAWREYAYLKAHHLVPESYVLAEVIDRFKVEDRKWKRGYVPLMANWLRDRRWDDQPEKAPTKSYAPDENGRQMYVDEADQHYTSTDMMDISTVL